MNPLDAPSLGTAVREVRPAEHSDRERLSDLILLESRVHRHLDWKTPLDWLGRSPYLVLQEGRHLTAALACPPDPPLIAWLRLFVHSAHLPGPEAWGQLWPEARNRLAAQGGGTVAAIVTQPWLEALLRASAFEIVNHIVLMEMNPAAALTVARLPDAVIRPMQANDLPRVVEVDSAAFEPLWRNSLEALAGAFDQAFCASVAEDSTGLLGYQLSTGGHFGTHLARLAVLPSSQGRGIGAALVNDLIAHIPTEREPRLTVNTQADNVASHALYARLGFHRTGERFPVYALTVPPASP